MGAMITTAELIRVCVSVLPVVLFLIVLIFLDSYKLVRFRSILTTVFVGVAVALVCLWVNTRLLNLWSWPTASYSRYVAPVVEEALKAGFIVYLIRSQRVGFMVDAAIHGFALGAGFAIIENLYWLGAQPDLTLFHCVMRGFGTAIMHGGATSLFALISQDWSERHESAGAALFLPGLGLAVIIHSLFNHFLISPVLSTAGLVVGLPLIMVAVFHHSEGALQKWLGVGFDSDAELLEMISTGRISDSRIGEYLASLKSHFSGEVVADMLCYLQLHVELSIRAKGKLLMREAGFPTPPDPATREKFKELAYLEDSIGTTGHLAIMPILRWSSRDLWQLHTLRKK
jgi:RsiW-degrading membrane proteinase PrsW (M82 family)